MKLHWSPHSPFVRKVMIVAHETGTVDQILCVRTRVDMYAPNPMLLADNPLLKIPALILDDGRALFDSRVISEYLDTLHNKPRLFPNQGSERFIALQRQALGDGLLDILLLMRREREKRPEQRVEALSEAFSLKVDAVLSALEADVPALVTTRFNIGHVTIGCALAYLDFRFADLLWRNRCPTLSSWHSTFLARSSVKAVQAMAEI